MDSHPHYRVSGRGERLPRLSEGRVSVHSDANSIYRTSGVEDHITGRIEHVYHGVAPKCISLGIDQNRRMKRGGTQQVARGIEDERDTLQLVAAGAVLLKDPDAHVVGGR